MDMQLLEKENAALRGKLRVTLEELELTREKLAFANEALVSNDDRWLSVASALRITKQQLLIVRCMFKHKHLASKEVILAAMFIHRPHDWPDAKILDVQVCKLRHLLPQREYIETVWGRGYRLSEEGRAWFQQQLDAVEKKRR
jgi:DNA-binding response OmpR family regulator